MGYGLLRCFASNRLTHHLHQLGVSDSRLLSLYFLLRCVWKHLCFCSFFIFGFSWCFFRCHFNIPYYLKSLDSVLKIKPIDLNKPTIMSKHNTGKAIIVSSGNFRLIAKVITSARKIFVFDINKDYFVLNKSIGLLV